MNIVDMAADPRVTILLRLLNEMSLATKPGEVARAWARHFWKLRPLDAMVNVSTRGCEPGQYRISRRMTAEEIRTGLGVSRIPDVPRPWAELPIHTGGLVGSLIAEPTPKLVTGLKLDSDPVLGDFVRGLGSMVAIPIFDTGKPLNWSLQFRVDPNGFQPGEVELALQTANLVGTTNRQMVLAHEVHQLNAALRAQFEEVARVQRLLLPRQIPDIPGLAIATSYLPSEQAGGDYYDFFEFGDGTWGMLIADVAGHGAAAATVMAMLHAILHAYVGAGRTPDTVLRHANARLVDAGLEGSFVTAFFAAYDPKSATLSFARAGHNPPRLKRGDSGEVIAVDGVGSLPLGVTEPYEVVTQRVRLHPRDTLVLYTDGVTEAMSRGVTREFFGVERLDATLEKCTGDPDCVVDSVHAALFEFTGSRDRIDDQTLVAIRYNGPALVHADPSAVAWLAAARRPDVSADLEALFEYTAATIESRGPACWASGRCCNFGSAGHRLYTTGLEAAYTVSRLDAPLDPAALQSATARAGCVFQSANLCSVHTIKPLACRIYFCDRSAQDWQRTLSERMHGQVRALHDRHGIEYRYAEWGALLALFV